MAEIPEHLLRRSRERRAAIEKAKGGGSAEPAAPAAEPAAATPAPAAAAPTPAAPTGPPARTAPPAAATEATPPPDPAYVLAAHARRKVPWWAMATLALMPVWGFMYWRAVTETETVVAGPMSTGDEIYGTCAGCHGGQGDGGVGYAFSNGEVIKSFPHIEDQLRYVYWGTGAYAQAGVQVPGNPDRDGGAHITGALGQMPQQGEMAGGSLTDYQILGVVCHERFALGGVDPSDGEFAEEYNRWCSPESPIFAALQAGELSLTTDEAVSFTDAEGTAFDVELRGSTPIEGSASE